MGGAVSRVVESRHAGFAPGDIVDDYTGWQDYAIAQGASARKVDPAMGPLSTAIGVLGMPGAHGLPRPRQGGPARARRYGGDLGGLRRGRRGRGPGGEDRRLPGPLASPAGAEKLRYLTQELGFDDAIDRHGDDLPGALAAGLPGRHRRLFRERRRADRRCHLSAAGPRRPRGDLRRHRALTTPPSRPGSRATSRRFLFTETEVKGFNIYSYGASLRACAQAPRPLAWRGPARLQDEGHRGRARERAGGLSAPVRRAQLRQAAGPGLGGVTGPARDLLLLAVDVVAADAEADRHGAVGVGIGGRGVCVLEFLKHDGGDVGDRQVHRLRHREPAEIRAARRCRRSVPDASSARARKKRALKRRRRPRRRDRAVDVVEPVERGREAGLVEGLPFGPQPPVHVRRPHAEGEARLLEGLAHGRRSERAGARRRARPRKPGCHAGPKLRRRAHPAIAGLGRRRRGTRTGPA